MKFSKQPNQVFYRFIVNCQVLCTKTYHIFILNRQRYNGKLCVGKDTNDYCLNLLLYLVPLCFLITHSAKRLTSIVMMMIIAIRLMCGLADVKTSTREMTKYKTF